MKRLRDIIRNRKTALTLETISPVGWDIDPIMADLKNSGITRKVDAFWLPNNPTARVRVDPAAYASTIMRELDIDVGVNLTTRDMNILSLQSWLLGAHAMGIREVVIMSGDHPALGSYPGTKRVDDLNVLELLGSIDRYMNRGRFFPQLTGTPVGGTRLFMEEEYLDRPTDFHSGAILIPDRRKELQRAAAKIDAGAKFFQTQITYDAENIIDTLQKLEDMKYTTEVFITVGAVSSPELLDFLIENIPYIRIPHDIRKAIKDAKDMFRESTEVISAMVANATDALKDSGLKSIMGVHITPIDSMNRIDELIDALR